MSNYKELATKHMLCCKQNFQEEIDACIYNSVIDGNKALHRVLPTKNTTIRVIQSNDPISLAARDTDVKYTIINAADSYFPGGDYIVGGDSTEAYLCHRTILYNILSSGRIYRSFYAYNREIRCQKFGRDAAVWTPDVLVDDGHTHINVITCPTVHNISSEEAKVYKALDERIQFVLNIAARYGAENLVISTFTDMHADTALLFERHLTAEFVNVFDTVTFCLPTENIKRVYEKYLLSEVRVAQQ